MKKVILLILVSILLLFAFTSCAKITSLKNKIFRKACEHEWTAATCTSPKTCNLCGETEGALGAHRTVDATCTTPQMCSICGFTSEYWEAARGHDWAEASCFKGVAKTCRVCELVEGEIPEHDWSEATCLEDSKCSVCNLTDEGSALGHDYVDAAEVPATCTTPGTAAGVKCSRCSDVQSGCQIIPALNHKGYEVEISGVPATCLEPGLTTGSRCTKCDAITEEQFVIDPLGHQRYTYNELGEKVSDGWKATVYPVNPETGVAFNECESDGTTTYECQLCKENIETVEPKVSHKYPEGAKCTDLDAKCEYCDKNIEHEFLDPTCTAAATCTICGDTDDTRPALNHTHTETGESAFLPATCLAPSTCELCGMTDGDKLTHKLTASAAGGRLNYSCTECQTSFSPLDESYYLDGSTHDNMVSVNNKFGGYETYVGDDGEPTQAPAIKTDAQGNKYYSLIKVKDPETDKSTGKPYPPQVQLWIPLNRGGFTGFSSSNSATGFLSFKINAYMTKNFSFTFVEGGAWAETDVIKDFFVLNTSVDEETGKTTVKLCALDEDNNTDTPSQVLFEKDITDATTVEEKFTGWHDVYIGIVLDDATDTINLHYYIDGMYRASTTTPLKTAGNGIKCIYVSGNTEVNGSGLMLDDIGFGYTVNGSYEFDVNHEHVYNVVSERVEPTCVNDGYIIYACDCGVIGTRTSIPSLGHVANVVEAVEPTCTTDGHNEYSTCTRCEAYIVKQIVYPATGHDFDTSKNKAPTCTTGGLVNQTCKTCKTVEKYQVPALGHEYALTEKCYEAANCIVCGDRSVGTIGHTFGDPTCTTPSTCMRDGCSVTTGEPLGHDMAAATCTVPQTCTRCDHTEGYRLAHTIEVKYVKSVLTYTCTGCDASFHFDKGYVLNGANTDNMFGVNNNTNKYTTTTGTDLPKIVDGHYELLLNTNADGKAKQLQLWIPQNDNPNNFGFSSENNAVGVLSFKMNVNMEQALTVKLVDGTSNSGTSRWTHKAVAGFMTISAASNGKVTFKLGFADESQAQTNAHIIAEIEVGEDNFTGWVDIVIGIVLDPVTDQVTYHCYTNGQYMTSFSAELTTKTNSINAVYISGNTTSKGSGLMLDDIAFGYTANGTWTFDECNHEGTPAVIAPTCTEDGYTKTLCTKCGHITITDVVPAIGHTEKEAPTCDKGSLCATCDKYYGEALGHKGGTATCTTKPVCVNCGKEYGSPSHDMVEATCSAAAYCKACEKVFGEKVSHKPVAKLENEKVTYSCAYCNVSYVLDQAYYQDGDASLGNVVTVMEDGGYVYDPSDSSFKFTLESAATNNGKAWVWMPTNGTGITDFEGFKSGTVGVLSFSLDVYTEGSFEVQLMDSDHRGDGNIFWTSYTMQIFTVTPPDKNNVVSLKGWDGAVLQTVNVSDSNKYTGMFDVAIGIELTGSNIVLHYYINGQYVTSITTQMKIASGKIDGVAFMCQSKVIGTGYTLDNIAFGYAKPYEGNPAPVKPKD